MATRTEDGTQGAKDEDTRTLWTMTKGDRSIAAAIYVTNVGRELRVTLGEAELLDSMLSRTGDEPLEQRADEMRRALEDKGWSLHGANL